MKKMLMCGLLALVICLTMAGTVRAENIKWGIDAASGDIVWDLRESGLGVGAGSNLASWKDGLFILRGELSTVNAKEKAGLGPGIDIVKGLQRLGATWIPKHIKSEVAILGAVDLSDLHIDGDDFAIQVVATILKIEW